MNVWWDVKQVTPPKKELLSQTEICWVTFEVRNGAIQVPRWNFKGCLLRNSLSSSKCPPPKDLKEHLPGWGAGPGTHRHAWEGTPSQKNPSGAVLCSCWILVHPKTPKCHLSLQLERGGCKMSGGWLCGKWNQAATLPVCESTLLFSKSLHSGWKKWKDLSLLTQELSAIDSQMWYFITWPEGFNDFVQA